MKGISDILIKNQLNEMQRLQRTMRQTQKEGMDELEEIKALCFMILDGLSQTEDLVSPELERAVKQVTLQSAAIDNKVED
jgi:hypothetical protein